MVLVRAERRKADVAQGPGEPRRMLPQPGIKAADVVDVLLKLCLDLIDGLEWVVPDVVLDRAVVGGGAGVGDHVELAIVASAGAAHNDAGENRIVAGREEGV